MITYQSTRGSSKKLSFEDIILSGVADDKGLYLPTSTTLENLSYLTQEDLTYEDFVKTIFIGSYFMGRQNHLKTMLSSLLEQ